VNAPTQVFTLTVGGVVWSSPSQTPAAPSSPSAPNPNFPVLGAEHLALATATTEAQFAALVPKLTHTPAETAVMQMLPSDDLGTRLVNLVMASNRLTVSPGAGALIANWSNALLAARSAGGAPADLVEQEILSDMQAMAKQVLDAAANDPYGLARGQLILAISNVRPLAVFTRSYTGFALLRGMDVVQNLNGMGRFLYRNALTKAYLATNPTLTSASTVLVPALSNIADPIAKAPLAQEIVAQYPELWYSLGGGK
jgi:hypothetical protein